MLMSDKKLTISGLIRKHAAEEPEKTAFIIDDVKTGYAELFRKIGCAAAYLSKKGVTAGKHVVSMACPKLEYFVLEYAILGLGAVHIPVENRVPLERLADIAKQVDADFIISPERPDIDAEWILASDIDLTGEEEFEPVPESDECAEIVFTTGI